MKAAYFGYLPKRKAVIGGGEVKTKTVLKAIKQSQKFEHIFEVDTSDWKRHLFTLLFQLIVVAFRKDVIIFVSSTSSFQKVLPLLLIIRKLNGIQIHFIPVGNCMPCNFDDKGVEQINNINGIYCQTETMANKLKEIGITNAYVMHNFKYIPSYAEEYTAGVPYRMVYFSRVSEEKGIFDCIDVISKINGFEELCKLDIYGKIDENIEKRFFDTISKKTFVSYCGNASPDLSSNIIKNYYMMIFPTKYEGEGFPGTLIDTFAAGVPVLSSKFGGWNDILTDGEDAILYSFADKSDLYEKMLYVIKNPQIIMAMRNNAKKSYVRYSPEKEINILLSKVEL